MPVEMVLKVNQMIAALYEEGDLKERLQAFYRDLYDLIYYDRVSIMLYKKAGDNGWEKQLSISLNWDDIQMTMDKYKEYYINIDDTMPILSQDKPIVFRSSEMFDSDQRKKTEYFQGFQVPSGCINSIEANLDLRSRIDLRGNFYVFRGSDKADFTERDEMIVRALQPHLSRVLRYYGEHNNCEMTAGNFPCECAAMLVLDNHFNIIEKSSSYLVMREQFGGKLDESIVNCCFAMKKIGSASSELGHYEARLEGMPYFVEILKQKTDREDREYKYICYVFDLSKPYHVTLEIIREKYGLTDREYAVFIQLLNGLDTKELATSMYISVPAVKKYCSSIYGKLGITSRNQIISALELTQ